MPYIAQMDRLALMSAPPSTVGELNYIIHLELFREYIDELAIVAIIDKYLAGKPPSYTLYNSVMGVLECVYFEFRQRKPDRPSLFQVAEAIFHVQQWLYDKYLLLYETEKCRLNGDVYPPKEDR